MKSPDFYQTLTTPSGLSIRIAKGSIFRTDKGLFIITNVVTNEAGSINHIEYVPMEDGAEKVLAFATFEAAVKTGKIKL